MGETDDREGDPEIVYQYSWPKIAPQIVICCLARTDHGNWCQTLKHTVFSKIFQKNVGGIQYLMFRSKSCILLC